MYGATKLRIPRTSVALLYPSVSVVNGLQRVGILYGARDLRAVLNNPATFGPRARRLYMYTQEDILVDWRAVQSHAEDAHFRGYSVDEIPFVRGCHCGFIMEDGDQYWTAIQRVKGEELTASGSPDVRSRS